MRVPLFSMAILIVANLMVSCTQDSSLQKKIAQHDNAIGDLYGSSSDLFRRVKALERKDATVDPRKKEFGIAKTDLGNLLVVCEDIQPEGDGQTITLLIGNPLNVTFHGYTITARYGLRSPTPSNAPDRKERQEISGAEADKVRKSVRENSFSISEDLLPGRWNRVNIVLAPAKPEEVGSLSIWISTNQVKLPRK